MSEQEYSDAGNPIYRYTEENMKPFELAHGDGDNIEVISNHIEKHIGKIEAVFHEIISDKVHIDVHWVKPSAGFPFHALVTSGMSDRPMNAPEGQNKYAEVCILLPPDWPIEAAEFKLMEDVFKEEKNYWPIRWLKTIARFPHDFNTWFGHGHTLPNGENADPFAESTKLGCMLLMPSISVGMGFYELKIDQDKTIHFLCLYPIYKEEMDFKMKKGVNALLDKFEKYKVSDVVHINRVNTCVKKGPFGLW